jgi:hypothetical protein
MKHIKQKLAGLCLVGLLISACGSGTEQSASANTPQAPDGRGAQATSPAPNFRAPNAPINRDNAPNLAYLGRLDIDSAPSSVFAHAFALDGSRLVALNDIALVGWELATGQRSFNVTRGTSVGVYYASDLSEFYTLEDDGTLVVRQTDTGIEQNRFGDTSAFGGVLAHQAEFDWLALADDSGGVQVWDLPARTSRATLRPDDASAPITALAFSQDGAHLATASADGMVRVWLWAERRLLASFEQADAGISGLAFAPDGRQIAAGTARYVAVWDIETAELAYSFNIGFGGVPDILRYAPDGRALVTGGFDSDMLLINPQDGTVIVQLPQVRGERISLDFAPDASMMLTGVLDEGVTLWDMVGLTNETIPSASLPVDSLRIVDVAWSPDGFLLAFFDAAGSVYLWGIPAPAST